MKSIILAGGVGTGSGRSRGSTIPSSSSSSTGTPSSRRRTERAVALSGADGIFVVTNEIHRYFVCNQVDELGYRLDESHLLVEPEGKNTLPAIGWAMQRIRETDSHATAAVFPSDHVLGSDAIDQIRAAEPVAKKYLVTFGVKPVSPHTGYGKSRPAGRCRSGAWLKSSERNRTRRLRRSM